MKVLFIHGFLGSAPNWGPIMSKIRADAEGRQWELLAVDLLGHGRRGQDSLPRPLTLEAVAKDLESQIPPGEWVAVAHSFGLRPLLKVVHRNPKLMKALIVEDTSPVLSEGGWNSLIPIFDGVPVPFASREEARQALNSQFGVDTPMSKFLLSNIREVEPGRHDWRFNRGALRELLLASKEEELWPEWEAYPGPIHMILGGRSSFVGMARVGECMARRTGKPTTYMRIEEAGHWVHSDQPVQFAEELIRVIRGL